MKMDENMREVYNDLSGIDQWFHVQIGIVEYFRKKQKIPALLYKHNYANRMILNTITFICCCPCGLASIFSKIFKYNNKCVEHSDACLLSLYKESQKTIRKNTVPFEHIDRNNLKIIIGKIIKEWNDLLNIYKHDTKKASIITDKLLELYDMLYDKDSKRFATKVRLYKIINDYSMVYDINKEYLK